MEEEEEVEEEEEEEEEEEQDIWRRGAGLKEEDLDSLSGAKEQPNT